MVVVQPELVEQHRRGLDGGAEQLAADEPAAGGDADPAARRGAARGPAPPARGRSTKPV